MKLRNKRTGKIVELDHISMHYNRPEEWGYQPCSTWDNSLAEFNEEWEDYEPKEPLIKDERIRKAVRAWAEANRTITKVYVMSNGYELYGGNTDSVIHFETLPFDHITEGDYTIDELCGEEE